MQTEKNFSEINFATLKNKQVTRRMGGSEDPPPPFFGSWKRFP